MKKILIITITLLVGVRVIAQSPKPVTITCKVINFTNATPQAFKLNFLNPFQQYPQSATLNSLHEFIATEGMLFTQNMTIMYNKTAINLYVAPGDSVHLTIDASLLNKPDFEWVTITGDHALLSSQLNRCHEYLSKIPSLKYNYALSAGAILATAKQDYERQLLILKEYAAKNKLDPEVIQWAERDLKYTVSNWISDYAGADSSITIKKDRVKLFADPFFDIYNAANFQTMMFGYHLGEYAHQLAKADAAIALALKKADLKSAASKGVALLLNEPAGISRDYMIYYYLSPLIKKSPAIIDSIGDVKHFFTRATSYNYLTALAAKANQMDFRVTPIAGVSYLKPDGMTSSIPAGDIYAYLSKKYPGKVIYVDVYATWCVPCLEEMKYAPKLHSAFKGKNVVFVNFCLQSGLDNWKKLVKKANITGENYFLDADAASLFMGTYRVSGFPAYMLVSKNGKLVTTNAPRPSESAALNNAITKLIDQ